MAGQIERDAAHALTESFEDRPPRRAVKRESVQEHDGHPVAVLLVGESTARRSTSHLQHQVHLKSRRRVSGRRTVTVLRYAVKHGKTTRARSAHGSGAP